MSWHKEIFEQNRIENFYTWDIKERLKACGVMRAKQITLLEYINGLRNYIVEMGAVIEPPKQYRVGTAEIYILEDDLL